MKLVFKFIYIFIVASFIGTVFCIVSHAESNITIDEWEIYKNELLTYDKLDGCALIQKTDNVYYLVENGRETKLPMYINNYIQIANFIYIIDNNHIYKLSVITKEITTLNLKCDSANSIIQYQDKIIIGGTKDNNVYLECYNTKLQELNELKLDGGGNEECNILFSKNEYIYIVGTKDGHVDNRFFANVGNKNDKKSFIFCLDEEFKIINTLYFNEHSEKEIISDIIYNDEVFTICLTTKEMTYIYDIDYQLNLINKQNVKKIKKLIATINNNYIYIFENDLNFYIQSISNDKEVTIKIIEGFFIRAEIIKGELKLFYFKDGYTYESIISEYHINHTNPLILDYFKNDENVTSHYSVESYFEKLTFKLNDITPFFQKGMFGEYEANYVSKRENGTLITFKVPLIVHPYVNIKNDGIYNKGTRLYFFGNAKLNNEPIINGTALEKEGENILELTSINNHTLTYRFIVVNDYYKDATTINMSSDYEMEYYDKLYIKLPNNVTKVFFSDLSEGVVIENDGCKYLEIKSKNEGTITEYRIISLELDDQRKINLDYQFTVKTKKKDPIFNISESNNEGLLNVNIDVNDESKCLDDIYVEVYQEGKIKQVVNSYFHNQKIEINNIVPKIPFKIYIKSKDENGKIVTLFTYEGINQKNEAIKINLDFSIIEGNIASINIVIDLSSTNLTHQQILLGNDMTHNLSNKYQIEKSYTYIYVSIALSIFLIGILVWIILKKAKKKKVNV